jgi:ABC-type sulfate/molybdate transport systems ATPase subunit
MHLEVQEIALRAGSFALGPLTLSVGDGEYLIVLGPTGAGKTLTLEAIAGLRPLDAGRVLMDRQDMTAAPPEARRIGFLYQDSLLFPHLSVRDNLAYGAHRLPRAERAAAVARLAGLLGIEPLLGRMPRGLSGGERQRVGLARALATNPTLLLLDEPMAALDPNSRHALRDRLRALHRELGTTTIHVTHNFSEAIALGDRVAVLIDGRVLQAGPAAEVFSRPDTAQIARFLSTARISGDAPEPGEMEYALVARNLALSLGEDGDAQALLVASDSDLSRGTAAPEAGDALPARVIAVENGGHTLTLRLSVAVEMRATLAPGASREVVEGAGVWVRLPRPAARS